MRKMVFKALALLFAAFVGADLTFAIALHSWSPVVQAVLPLAFALGLQFGEL